MGIPLWREPSEPEVSKPSARDASAAARSAIRRHASFRRSSRHSPRVHPGGVLTSFHSQILDEIQRGAPRDEIDLGARAAGDSQPGVRSSVLNRGISEDGLDLDTTRRDVYGVNALIRAGPHDTANRDGILSDRPGRSESQSQSRSENRSTSPRPSFTPNFAPAFSYRTLTSMNPGLPLPGHPLPGLDRRAPISESTASSSSATLRNLVLAERRERIRLGEEAREQELQEISWRSRQRRLREQELQDTSLNGLGDRQRSVSLGGDGEGDAWEPMFSTITPDLHLPSNDNSFSSSNAAPDNDTPRNGPPQLPTNPSERMYPVRVTLPMSHEPYSDLPDFLNPCDLSSSDDEDTPVNYHRIIGPSGTPIGLRRLPGHNSTMSNHPPVPTISFSFSDAAAGDTHLQQMQAILDRLARREDIPDDLWAGAGLSRTMGRGLNTGANPPNDNNGRAFDE